MYKFHYLITKLKKVYSKNIILNNFLWNSYSVLNSAEIN